MSVKSFMNKRFRFRFLAILAALAVLIFATAAMAHGHLPGKADADVHCAFCQAIHSGHSALGTSPTVLEVVLTCCALLSAAVSPSFSSSQFLRAQDRAPPLA